MRRFFLFSKAAQGGIALFLALILVGFYEFAVVEEQAIFQDSSHRIDEEKFTIRGMEQQLGKTKQAVNLYQRNLEEIGYFHKQYLQQKDERLLKISKFLEAKARERALALSQVGYHTDNNRERDLELQLISLPLAGRYRDIRAFIGDVESSDLLLLVHSLNISDVQGQNGGVSVDLVLATYFKGGQHE